MKTIFKLLASISILLIGESLFAQTTINPDTVCFGTTAETYWVTNNANSSYQWSVDPASGGVIVSGQGTNSIVIDWSATPLGLYTDAITLVETDNTTTCSGQVTIDVEVIPIPANLQAVSVTACEGGVIPDLFTQGGIPSSQFEWYSDPALTNFLGTGSTYATGQTAVGVYTYYVVEVVNGCSGLPVQATLTITSLPTADAGVDDAICEGDTYTLNGTATNNNGLSWTSSGDGSFSNASISNPVYTPGAGDIAAGTVNLTLTVFGNNPCTDVNDLMVLSITPLPTADAGVDDAICEGDTYTLNGTATNNNGISWTSSGDGSFSNASISNPVYTPGISDIATGSVDLTFTVNGNGSCTNAVDQMVLSITPLPTSDAGTDDAICSGDTYALNGSATNNNGVLWTSSGDGTFSNASISNPVYTPGAADITAGSVNLTFSAIGNGVCADATDLMILSITPLPTADAGTDDAICSGDTYALNGIATNNSGLSWTSSGDGSFSNASISNPVYTPGPTDIATGSVSLTFTASGNGSCLDATDIMLLSITAAPTADAGVDDAICEGNDYTLSGTATNNNGLLWTSSGDGTFSNASVLNPVYTPGPADITAGSVDLTLTVNGNSPCANINDIVTITISASPTPGPIQHN